jgi:hypothetical protein
MQLLFHKVLFETSGEPKCALGLDISYLHWLFT